MATPPMTPATPMTPQKRKATGANDFYTLLKSPDVRMGDDPVKKRAKELNMAINKSPNPHTMRELSQTLKTRLNYANIKVQHGWNSIDEAEDALLSPKQQQPSQFSTPMASNGVLHLDHTPLAPPQFSPRPLSNFGTPYSSRRRGSAASLRLDDIANRGVSNSSPDRISASLLSSPQRRSSFKMVQPPVLKLSQSQQPQQQQQQQQQSQLQSPQLPLLSAIGATINNKPGDQNLEQDAIMSLISLSSPVKYSHSHSSSMSDSSPSPVLPKPSIGINSATELKFQDRLSRSPYHSRGPSNTSISGMGINQNLKQTDNINNNYNNISAVIDDEETTEEEIEEDGVEALKPGFGAVPLTAPRHFDSKPQTTITDSTDEEADDADATIDESYDNNINDTFGEKKEQEKDIVSTDPSPMEPTLYTRDPFRETTFDQRKKKMTTKKE